MFVNSSLLKIFNILLYSQNSNTSSFLKTLNREHKAQEPYTPFQTCCEIGNLTFGVFSKMAHTFLFCAVINDITWHNPNKLSEVNDIVETIAEGFK